MSIDSIVTRSIISENLGDYSICRADIIQIITDIVPTNVISPSMIVSAGISVGVDGNSSTTTDISQNPLKILPGPIRRLVLHCAARLPLVERSMGLVQECYKSFRRCISGT
jgi:hypothetical protein